MSYLFSVSFLSNVAWKALFEIILVIVLLIVGFSFWAIVKSPRNFRRTLTDSNQLSKFFESYGPNKLLEEAQRIKPIAETYVQNIAILGRAHFSALSQTRNLLLFLAIACVAGSYFLGISYCVANVGVFFIPAAFGVLASAKNYNLSHVYTVAVNVAKWNGEDRSTCTAYCTRSDPTLSRIHSLIDGIQYPEEMPPTGSDEPVRQSIELWKEHLERNPNDYETWAALGAAYAKLDRYLDALASFQEAISANPKYAEAYLGLGSTYGFLDQTEDKIAACKKAIELKPDYADAYATLGSAYARVGISSDAIAAYKTALLLKPNFYYIRYALGTAYLVSGDTEAAFGEARLLELQDASLAKELYELIQRFRAAR